MFRNYSFKLIQEVENIKTNFDKEHMVSESTCNVREHFVNGADVSCCAGVADWECALTLKTALCTGAHQQRFGINVWAGITFSHFSSTDGDIATRWTMYCQNCWRMYLCMLVKSLYLKHDGGGGHQPITALL